MTGLLLVATNLGLLALVVLGLTVTDRCIRLVGSDRGHVARRGSPIGGAPSDEAAPLGLLHRLRHWLYPERAWRSYLVARERREGRSKPLRPQERDEALRGALRAQSEAMDRAAAALRDLQDRRQAEQTIRRFLPPKGGDLRRSLLGDDPAALQPSVHVPGQDGSDVCVTTMGQVCSICVQRHHDRQMALSQAPTGILMAHGALSTDEARRLKEEWQATMNAHVEVIQVLSGEDVRYVGANVPSRPRPAPKPGIGNREWH